MKTIKQQERDNKATDWEKRIEILTLHNQGWSLRKIATKLEVSSTTVTEIYNKTKDLTIKELEELSTKYGKEA